MSSAPRKRSSQPAAPSRRPLAAQLSLHGDPRVLLADGRAVTLERRAAALCALAAMDSGATRERAARWLWPDSDDPRRNLRQQLLRFRRTLELPLLGEGDSLALAPGVQLVAAETGAALLGEFDFSDCPEFAAWLEARRNGDSAAHKAALRERIARTEADGDLDAACAAAEALIRADPDSEAHHRELMRLHYLRGDSTAGLAAYSRLSELLAASYGAQPSAHSAQLAELLRAIPIDNAGKGRTPAHAVARQALPVTLKRPPLLAGRERERTSVLAHWAEGRAVLLEGEAGLGKSRLMAELLAGNGGVVFAAGRPGDAGAPYATLARLLRPLLEDGGGTLDARTQDTLAHLAPMAAADSCAAAGEPAARHGARIRPPPGPLRPGAMAAAVNDLLLRHQRHVVALDDLHFADDATVELLAGLAAQNDPPRRWIVAARPAELPAAAQSFRAALSEEQRPGHRLAERAGRRRDRRSRRRPGHSGLARPRPGGCAVAPHPAATPLFVLETLKHGLSDGSLVRGELPRPLSVGSLIERRLQRLSEPALTLARVAAIAGVDFSIELAESAIGVRAVQLASAWSELQDAQVLRDEGFAHDLVADAALRSVPPVVARRVHGQCAQWLAAHGVEPARVAWHWRLGGMPAEAGRAFAAAALRAEQAARLREEAALLQHAASAFADAGLAEERFDALVKRVRALNLSEFDDLALQECRDLADAACSDAQRLRAHSELCGLLTERGESAAALESGRAAMALGRQLGDQEWQVRTACHMAAAPVPPGARRGGHGTSRAAARLGRRPGGRCPAFPLARRLGLGTGCGGSLARGRGRL